MGNDDRRAAFHHGAKCGLDLRFGAHVKGRGGVVEHEHRRVGQKRPGEAQALALSARQRQALFSHHRVNAVGQQLHEIERFRLTQRQANVIVRGIRAAEGDI